MFSLLPNGTGWKKDQDWFVNGVVAAETSLGPREFLEFLLYIERRMGRERGERWGPRVIDLDILLFGEMWNYTLLPILDRMTVFYQYL